jgi:hypothetical protein
MSEQLEFEYEYDTPPRSECPQCHRSECPQCHHDWYWHEQRRADDPSQFFAGKCLCGCEYAVVKVWS